MREKIRERMREGLMVSLSDREFMSKAQEQYPNWLIAYENYEGWKFCDHNIGQLIPHIAELFLTNTFYKQVYLGYRNLIVFSGDEKVLSHVILTDPSEEGPFIHLTETELDPRSLIEDKIREYGYEEYVNVVTSTDETS